MNTFENPLSGSFAGLLFLSYYLAGKLQCFSAPAPKSLLNFIIALSPSLLALFIALSRYCDYWHHYQVGIIFLISQLNAKSVKFPTFTIQYHHANQNSNDESWYIDTENRIQNYKSWALGTSRGRLYLQLYDLEESSPKQDVVWGSVIGGVIATISYFYYYPSLWDPSSHWPRDTEHVGKQFNKKYVPLLPQSVKVM